jgi:hypothetical protein
MSIATTNRTIAGNHLATYEQMRAKNLAVFDQAKARRAALEEFAAVVANYVTQPDADPEVVAAFRRLCEAGQ